MGRRSRPWKRGERGWYVCVHGRQVKLAGPHATARDADRAHRELLSAPPDHIADASKMIPTVAEAASRWLAYQERRRADGDIQPCVVRLYRYKLKPFVARFGSVRLSDLRAVDVADWVASHAEWGPTTRAAWTAAYRSLSRWAHRGGLIPHDPLVGLKGPTPRRRELILTPEQWATVRAAIDCPRLRDVLDFLHATGCRPCEAYRLEARHVAPDGRVAVMPGKTTRKTGRPRVLILGPSAAAIVARLAAEHPTGPLFRSPNGLRWTSDKMYDRMRHLRALTGFGRELTAYSFRHLFATDALEAGVEIATVSTLLGHADTTMVARVYSHLGDRLDVLAAAAERVRGK